MVGVQAVSFLASPGAQRRALGHFESSECLTLGKNLDYLVGIS